MSYSAFDLLLTKNVPHVLEAIFLSLDYESFKKCMEVTCVWKRLLNSATIKQKAKSVYRGGILRDEKKLFQESGLGNEEEVRRLLRIGILDVNFALTLYLDTPLMSAANRGHIQVVQLLLNGGADPNKTNYAGWTALHSAAMYGYSEMAQLLMEQGAEPDNNARYGSTPLHTAVWSGQTGTLKELLKGGADPNKAKQDGETPLHMAAQNLTLYKSKIQDIIQLLLEGGADPDRANERGLTPLDMAASHGNKDIVQTFIGGGADLTRAQTTCEQTPGQAKESV